MAVGASVPAPGGSPISIVGMYVTVGDPWVGVGGSVKDVK